MKNALLILPLTLTEVSAGQSPSLPPATVFDNSQIRVLRIKKEARQKTPAHYVPALLVIYLSTAHYRMMLPDGPVKDESYAAGDFRWWNGGERPASENLEADSYEFLTVRVKESAAGTAQSPPQATLPFSTLRIQSPGMADLMVFDNDRLRVYKMAKAPREPGKMHDASGRLLVFLTDGHLRRTFPDKPPEDDTVHGGDLRWWPPGMHASENMGGQEVKFLMIVPKPQSNASSFNR